MRSPSSIFGTEPDAGTAWKIASADPILVSDSKAKSPNANPDSQSKESINSIQDSKEENTVLRIPAEELSTEPGTCSLCTLHIAGLSRFGFFFCR